jgi:uncharacterized protein (DUF1800 family)
MKMRAMTIVLMGVLAVGAQVVKANAQMMEPQTSSATSPQQSESMPAEAAQQDPAQQKAAQTFAAKKMAPAPPAKNAALIPLTPRERVVQLLDRFAFGPKPGEVDRVLAMGAERWLEQQMNPNSINDNGLNKRLADFPTLGMTALQAVTVFPDRPQVYAIADGKVPYPVDPLMNALYEEQVYRLDMERDRKKVDGTAAARVEPTEAEKAAQKEKDKATATRVASELIALPKEKRMAALIAMPIEDRIAFVSGGNLSKQLDDLLINDFTPREREMIRAMSGNVSSSYYIGNELSQGRILTDVLSERQLQQVMTDFWFNHFNIYQPKDSDAWYTTSYVRDVIRAHALSSFRELLLATAQSPAMMVYLDNYLSIGPDSIANGVDPSKPNSKKGNKGLNENYGREVMELHTVGVNGGYTQADVTALSAILTGWGVDRVNQGGGFLFDPKRHEPGPKTWLGYQIADDGRLMGKNDKPLPPGETFGPSATVATDVSVQQGITALNILADSPQTAHFISFLLAQYFVADEPPPALVDRLTKTFLSSKGDIKTMLRAIIASPEFNSRQFYRNKVKTPEEFVASAFRASATDPQNPGALVNTVRSMGMEMYHALPPTGYYLTADQWMNSVALVDRLNFAYALTNNKLPGQKFDAPKVLAMGLLAPSTMDELSGPSARPASAPVVATGKAKMMGVADKTTEASATTVSAGTEVAMRVLEASMIGVPVSAQTNHLIDKQMSQLPANANSTDTLNLLTALVLGSPEFQVR